VLNWQCNQYQANFHFNTN